MRYVIKWANGHWIIFDNEKFEPVRFAGTEKEIVRIYDTGK